MRNIAAPAGSSLSHGPSWPAAQRARCAPLERPTTWSSLRFHDAAVLYLERHLHDSARGTAVPR